MRYKELDALRGLAALSVAVHHLAVHYWEAKWVPVGARESISLFFIHGIDLGRFGVVLFFLLSGFLIPFSLQPGSTLGRFAVRRFFRLYPAFWVSLIFSLLVDHFFLGRQYSSGQIAANVTMLPQLFGHVAISGTYWTLAIELFFYFGCAALFFSGLLSSRFVLVCVSITFALATAVPVVCNEFLKTSLPVQFVSFHLSFLFAGAFFRAEMDEGKGQNKSISLLGFLVILVPVVAGLIFSAKSNFNIYDSWAIPVAYVAAMLLFLVVVRFSISFPGFAAVGDSSYSLYLLHWPVFVIVTALLPDEPSYIVPEIFLCLALSFLLAYLSYKFLEIPFNNVGKNVSSRASAVTVRRA